MATKTDRILSYLPPTIRAVAHPSALHAVVDAFGQQLLEAENSLGAVMLAHWVDYADQGAPFITDLNCFAALYGLAPRGASKDVARFEFPTCVPVSADETVEQFRAHLKRYVLTFIDGTVTVQGILRIVAEALDLNIADSYAEMDTWWTTGNDPLTKITPRADDAAQILFGNMAEDQGATASPAWMIGPVLPATLDLGNSRLTLRLGGLQPIDINLAPHSRRVSLADVVAAINRRCGAPIASAVNGRLRLASLSRTSQSLLEILHVPGDAAETLLGLHSLTAVGSGPTAACIIGQRELYGSHLLTKDRYLRLRVDNVDVAEVDCAGEPAKPRTLPEIVSRINRAFGFPVAFQDRGALKLVSPTTGPTSSLAIERAGAQDAAEFLLGRVERVAIGGGPRQARLLGVRSLTGNADLTRTSELRIAVDDGPFRTVECAGGNPRKTSLTEIIEAINETFGYAIASHSGGATVLSSPTTGPRSRLALLPHGERNATEAIFGFRTRVFDGSSARAGRIVGRADLRAGVDLRSQHLLRVAIDGAPAVAIDLWQASENLKSVKLGELRTALNKALGPGIASDDGHHLILTSPSRGPKSSVTILPVEDKTTQHFVTRAYITDEAAPLIFGFLRSRAVGSAAAPARMLGEVDLSGGVDLRQNRYLRILVDGRTEDFDFASTIPIPRGATLNEIVGAINSRFHAEVASHDGKHLILTSGQVGSSASIVISDPAFEDASDILLGAGVTTVNGSDGTGIIVKGTTDLSTGIDLSAADSISIKLDGAAPLEIHCAGPDPRRTTLQQIVTRINTALKVMVANQDGRHIVLAPPSDPSGGELDFKVPRGGDATAAIFGFDAPRSYRGRAAAAASVMGAVDLSSGVDLTRQHFLSLAVDGYPPISFDCARDARNPTRVLPSEILRAINTAFGAPIADLKGFRLVLRSRVGGSHGSIEMKLHQTGYAGNALFGPKTPTSVTGVDTQPAVIRGQRNLGKPIDLSGRQVIRIAVDGKNPVDVNVAGELPEQTTLGEIVWRINTEIAGLASQTSDDRLRLESPTTGVNSSLELLPLRALELIDYPPAQVEQPLGNLQIGDRCEVDNDGACDSTLDFRITAPQGEVGMEFVNTSAGVRVRVMEVLSAGETLDIHADTERGLIAGITSVDGASRAVPSSAFLAGVIGAEAFVAFDGEWALSHGGGADIPSLLQLNDPSAPDIVVLRALSTHDNDGIFVTVRRSMNSGSASLFDVTLRLDNGGGRPIVEKYPSVEIGRGLGAKSLAAKILAAPSRLVQAEERSKASLLDLARGRTELVYMNSHTARFDRCYFPADPGSDLDTAALADEARFAGGSIREFAVFDISRFSGPPQDVESACFAPPRRTDPDVQASVYWTRFQPGAFRVNLPADLDAQFGARFDRDRFGMAKGGTEQYNGVVTEPPSDPNYIVKRINAGSTLVRAKRIGGTRPPAGWDGAELPFINPRSHTLSGGRDGSAGKPGEPARMYVFERGVPGFIELSARSPGAWGNAITVTGKKAGAVRFDVGIGYEGLRFENARQVALAGTILAPGADPLSRLTAQILKPAPVGVLQAKAAGVRADVTRDRTEVPPQNDSTY